MLVARSVALTGTLLLRQNEPQGREEQQARSLIWTLSHAPDDTLRYEEKKK